MNYEALLLPNINLDIIYENNIELSSFNIDELNISISDYINIDEEGENFCSVDGRSFDKEISSYNKNIVGTIDSCNDALKVAHDNTITIFIQLLNNYFKNFDDKLNLYNVLKNQKVYEDDFPYFDWLYDLRYIKKLKNNELNEKIDSCLIYLLKNHSDVDEIYNRFFGNLDEETKFSLEKKLINKNNYINYINNNEMIKNILNVFAKEPIVFKEIIENIKQKNDYDKIINQYVSYIFSEHNQNFYHKYDECFDIYKTLHNDFKELNIKSIFEKELNKLSEQFKAKYLTNFINKIESLEKYYKIENKLNIKKQEVKKL